MDLTTMTLGDIGKLFMVIGGIGGVISFFWGYAYKHTKEHQDIKSQLENSDNDIEALMKSNLGILNGMIEQGLNGPTKAAKSELEDYLFKRNFSQKG